MKPLTEIQAKILEYIRSDILANGAPPTAREICREFGFKSPRAATNHLRALEQKGHLRHSPGRSRNLILSDSPAGIPIVGRVAAGHPILAVEHREGILDVAADFGPLRDLFAVRVQGQSMRDAGILDGDYVVVRQSPVVENGRIGVAYLDGEATVKRIVHTKTGYRLQPENAEFQPIIVENPQTDFRFAGPVVGLVRRMG
jgi:repressor LexA